MNRESRIWYAICLKNATCAKQGPKDDKLVLFIASLIAGGVRRPIV